MNTHRTRDMAAGSPPEAPSAVHLLHRAAQRADELFTRAAQGLSPRQFEVLRAVAHADGLSQTAIMAATGIDRSSTASFVARLVRSGLLQRRRVKTDNRTYAVRITAKGRQILEANRQMARAADEALLSALPSPIRADFLRLLERIVAAQ